MTDAVEVAAPIQLSKGQCHTATVVTKRLKSLIRRPTNSDEYPASRKRKRVSGMIGLTKIRELIVAAHAAADRYSVRDLRHASKHPCMHACAQACSMIGATAHIRSGSLLSIRARRPPRTSSPPACRAGRTSRCIAAGRTFCACAPAPRRVRRPSPLRSTTSSGSGASTRRRHRGAATRGGRPARRPGGRSGRRSPGRLGRSHDRRSSGGYGWCNGDRRPRAA